MEGFAMKSSALGILRRSQGVVHAAVFLLAAGCSALFAPPPDLREGGRVDISIGAAARTVAPEIDQFSKIEISFERRDRPGTLAPVTASGWTASVYLPSGTWELTASAYNRGDPPEIVAQAGNTLISAGGSVSGETHFVLAPTGAGTGTLRYAVVLPLGMEASSGRIRIERDGQEPEERALEGGGSGEFFLEGGRSIVDIAIEGEGGTSAVFREAAAILPGLVTVVNFAPGAADFLDPELRAALAAAPNFRLTAQNSSRAVIEEAGGGGIYRTQRLSAPRGTASVCFFLEKSPAQTVSVEGADAAMVSLGAADGETPDPAKAVFAVDTSGLVVGDRVFDLALAEPGKENVLVAVTVTIGYITELSIESLPAKRVYIQGENFDGSGLVLRGTYRDGSALAEPDLGAYKISGFDANRLGQQAIQASVRGKSAGAGFLITVTEASNRDLYFDYGVKRSQGVVQPNRYTVPLGRTLVLAPVKWHIPDDVVYEWTVDNVIQQSTTEYLSLTPAAQGEYAVTVTVKIGGAALRTASTTVACVAPEGTYKRSAGGNRVAERIIYHPAPGQHVNSVLIGATVFTCCGAWGGYTVYKFDHSVARGSGKELSIGGNGFKGWSEPGVVWVMQDENGDGEPNDTWYELAGSHTLLPQAKRRLALTYTKRTSGGASWEDNYGSIGTTGGWPGDFPSPMTFVGTGLPGHYGDTFAGYVDAYGEQRYSIMNAIQVDGSPVNLSYIDFVKVQTSLNVWADVFGEISTEIYDPPEDIGGPPDPAKLLTGTAAGGQHNYQFINNSGYELTVTLADIQFALAPGASVTKTIEPSQAYFDFYGGNVVFVRETGKVTFADRPE
jgi:hypothetical protein